MEWETAIGFGAFRHDDVHHWARRGQVWPRAFYEEDEIPEHGIQQNILQRLRARKRSLSSRRCEGSEGSTGACTHSDSQGEQTVVYKNSNYESVLEIEAGSYTRRHKSGISKTAGKVCQFLLDSPQSVPKNTFFRDNVFDRFCDELRGKSEAGIFKDCTPLIVPWVEALAILKFDHTLDIAIESVDESWKSSIPIIQPPPQPKYSVGFKRSAFSEEQLEKLQSFLGDPSSLSYFKGTYSMYFPFFTCEVKPGSAGLDIADRQNLHSMTLAARGVVELFRLVGRVEELHREVLAFSVSHDCQSVRIYCHYPMIEGTKITYWRQALRKYDFTERKGIEKWTAYKFIKNVYEIWMPIHFRRISAAIDGLAHDQELDISLQVAPQTVEPFGLPESSGNQNLQNASRDLSDVHLITPDASLEKNHESS